MEIDIISIYFLTVILLIVMVPAAALGTPTSQQNGNFIVSVAGTAVGSVPHQIDLKVTQLPGGQLSEVTGFIVGPEDVVQVNQGENLFVATSPDLRIHQVTLRNLQGQQINLAPLPGGTWALQGLIPGMYTLDVTADMSSSGILGTYETYLVVLEPGQQPLPPTTVISRITIEYTEVCPGNSTLVNGTCVNPPLPNYTIPLPNSTIPLPNSTIPLPNATELPPKDNGSDVLPILPVTEPICDPGFRDFGFGCEAVEDTTEEETNESTDDDDNIEGDDNNNGNNDDFNNDESDNQESDESSESDEESDNEESESESEDESSGDEEP